jgi:hypothetical protein
MTAMAESGSCSAVPAMAKLKLALSFAPIGVTVARASPQAETGNAFKP